MADTTIHYDNVPNDYVTLTFTGQGIALWSPQTQNPVGGTATISIDGAVQSTNANFYGPQNGSLKIWSISGLSSGSHIFKLLVNGDGYVGIDHVVITP